MSYVSCQFACTAEQMFNGQEVALAHISSWVFSLWDRSQDIVSIHRYFLPHETMFITSFL